MNSTSFSAASSSASRCMRWRLVGRIWATCGTVSGPSSARLRMKPNAPPPQLVMSPAFWPRARILKKHWATSSISSAIASALPSTIGPGPVFRPTSVLCRVDAIACAPFVWTVQFLQLTPLLSTFKMTPWLSFMNGSGLISLQHQRERKMDQQHVTDTGTPGLIARPPLLFLAALLLGFIWDRLLPLPFPGTDMAHWIIGGSLILVGLALAG